MNDEHKNPIRADKISIHAVVVLSKDQVSADLDGETAILNLKNGVYYGLDEVGSKIWNLIKKPKQVREVRDAILDEYDVEPDRCERDLCALFEKMLTAGLIEVKNGTAE